MNWYDWVGYAVLGAMAMALIILFPLSIGKNLSAGHRYRKKLAQKLDNLPLGGMLQRLGIDQYKFLHEEDGVHLHRNIQRCESCEAKNVCEETQAGHARLDPRAIDFCPNQQDLAQVARATDKS